jgi:hypothetical protein
MKQIVMKKLIVTELEIFHLLRNPKGHCRVHKISPLGLVLSQLIAVNILG